jgi:hypothetical protein
MFSVSEFIPVIQIKIQLSLKPEQLPQALVLQITRERFVDRLALGGLTGVSHRRFKQLFIYF